MTFVCSIVVDRVSYRKKDGSLHQPPGRIIVASVFDRDSEFQGVLLKDKFIAPTVEQACSYVHNRIAYGYNGLDVKTLASGESLWKVLSWLKQFILSHYKGPDCIPKIVVSCAQDAKDLDLDLFSPYYEVCNLQDFFYQFNYKGIREPISLHRLTKTILGHAPQPRRDPFQEAIHKIRLHWKQLDLEARGELPPFTDTEIPKFKRILPKLPPLIV